MAMKRLPCCGWMLATFGALAMGCSDDGLGVGGVGDAGSSGSAGEMSATMSASAGMTTAGGMSASASGGDTTAATTDDDGLDDTVGPGSTSTGGADGPMTDSGGSTTDAASTGGGSTGGGSTDGGSTDGGSTDGGSTDGNSTDDGGSSDGNSTDDGGNSTDGGSSSDDGASSSDGGTPQVEGFGDCVNNPPATVCLPDEQCVTDLVVPPTQGVCTDPACVDSGDCPLAPPGGTAPVICTDVTGEGINECIIACAGGGTCPTGMFCALGLACAWAAD